MTGWKTPPFLKRILPCFLVGHAWDEWKHDDHYIKEADMETRGCFRQHWYSNRQRKWMGEAHFQKKWMGKIQ